MSDVNLSISQEIVKPIIDAKISAAIVAALGDESKMIETVVGTVLGMKVNSEGKRDNYEHHNKTTLVEHLCLKEIKAATESAIKEYFVSHGDLIKKAMKKYLDKNTGAIAQEFVKGLIADASAKYHSYTVEIKSVAK